MTLHAYAPESIRKFLNMVKILPVKIHKAKSSHSVGLTIPVAMIDSLKQIAKNMNLSFQIVKYRKQVQILIKSNEGLYNA